MMRRGSEKTTYYPSSERGESRSVVKFIFSTNSKNKFPILVLTSCLLLSPSLLHASDLGEIRIVAPDMAPRHDSSASSQVIIPEQSEASTTTQIIEKSPGIHVKRYGSNEGSAAISIRGAPANQISTYYDNAPLNGASGNAMDLSITPPANLDKVEIYRGGAPGKASEASPGGAIFLNTPGRPESFGINFTNSYGSFNTYRGNLQITQPFKKTWYLVSFEHSQSDGDFLYADNNGTWTNTADDSVKRRTNNDYTSENLLTKFGAEIGNWELEVSNTYLDKRSGIPGLGSFQSTTARLAADRNITILNADRKSTHITAFFDYLNSRFSDPNGEIGLGRQDNNDDTFRFGEEASHTFAAGRAGDIYVSAFHRGEYFQPKNDLGATTTGDTSSRHETGVVGEDTILMFSERLAVTPSLRFTALLNRLSTNDPSTSTGINAINDKNYYQLTGKLGTKYRLVADLYARANLYRGFRNPNFTELFGDRGTVVGNPELQPEEAINFDAGLVYDAVTSGGIDRFRAEAAYFRNYEKNLIQFLQTSQFTAKPQNLSNAAIQGVEASAQIAYLGRFSHSASYTFQHAKDTSGTAARGKFLPGRPQHEIWIESAAYNGLGKIYCEYNFMSGTFLDTQNILEITGRHLFNIGLSATPKKWVLINFTAKNITNNRTVDVIGFPLPGRSYWGTVTFII